MDERILSMIQPIESKGRGEAIMLINLGIILFSNSHNVVYYADKLVLANAANAQLNYA